MESGVETTFTGIFYFCIQKAEGNKVRVKTSGFTCKVIEEYPKFVKIFGKIKRNTSYCKFFQYTLKSSATYNKN